MEEGLGAVAATAEPVERFDDAGVLVPVFNFQALVAIAEEERAEVVVPAHEDPRPVSQRKAKERRAADEAMLNPNTGHHRGPE